MNFWAHVKAPPGVIPILFLDSFRVHMMCSVVTKIQALGVEVEFIPPSCTGLVQPIDVGYNKAFKAKVRGQFNDWLMSQDPDAPIAKTTRCHVIEWILAAEQKITAATIRNAWQKTGFSYFWNSCNRGGNIKCILILLFHRVNLIKILIIF